MIASLLVCAHLWAAGSPAELDRRFGFRGIRFGTPITSSLFDGGSLEGLGPEGWPVSATISSEAVASATAFFYARRGTDVEVHRRGEEMRIGSVSIEGIRWGFYGGLLDEVTVDTNVGSFFELLDALKAAFGAPEKVGHADDAWAWDGRKVSLLAGYTSNGGYASFSLKGSFERKQGDFEREQRRRAKDNASAL